jgi:preprotein translocase subunit SecG
MRVLLLFVILALLLVLLLLLEEGTVLGLHPGEGPKANFRVCHLLLYSIKLPCI